MGPSFERIFKICLIGSAPFNKIAAIPYLVETLQNLLLQNQESFQVESWYKALGIQGLPIFFFFFFQMMVAGCLF